MECCSFGFLFSPDKKYVVLIRSAVVEYENAILYDCVGGHVEDKETFYDAMKREFQEETGVLIDDWCGFATLKRGDVHIEFFKACSKDYANCKTQENEDDISVIPVSQLRIFDLYPNLKFLINMALDEEIKHSTLIY